ncbi:hypothetical protein ACXM1Q_000190 [Streptococcus sp. 10F2]
MESKKAFIMRFTGVMSLDDNASTPNELVLNSKNIFYFSKEFHETLKEFLGDEEELEIKITLNADDFKNGKVRKC